MTVATKVLVSLLAQWLRQASQGHEGHCPDHGFEPWSSRTWHHNTSVKVVLDIPKQ